MSKLEIYKYLDLCTSHLTEQDYNKFSVETAEAFPVVIYYEFTFGWWLYVSPEPLTPEQIFESGFTQAVVNILELARANDCLWVKLDCDGAEVEDLEVHEW